MRPVFLICVAMLGACNLFKPRAGKEAVVDSKADFFSNVAHPEFRQALYMDYTSSSGDMTIYPLDDQGAQFDYTLPDSRGSVRLRQEVNDYRRYRLDFEAPRDGFYQPQTLWLSGPNYQELQKTGKTTMRFANDSLITFQIKGITKMGILMHDTMFSFEAVEIVAEGKPYYMSFLPDPNYPLIVKLVGPVNLALTNIRNRPENYNTFVPGKGCVLKYRMVERYTEEYEVTLTNKVWTDSMMVFRVNGNYSGAEYSYNFDYDIAYKGKAIWQPDFVIPFFSAVTGMQEEDSFNWFLLRKDEFTNAVENSGGILSIPHYTENPDEDREAYEDTASYNEAKRQYLNSFKTACVMDTYGRIPNTDFMFYGNDSYDEQLLPSYRFYSPEFRTQIEILKDLKFPLLLYYGDGYGEIEINLVYAGFIEE